MLEPMFLLTRPILSEHTDVPPRPQRTSRRWPRPSLAAKVNYQGVIGETPAYTAERRPTICYSRLTSRLINERR